MLGRGGDCQIRERIQQGPRTISWKSKSKQNIVRHYSKFEVSSFCQLSLQFPTAPPPLPLPSGLTLQSLPLSPSTLNPAEDRSLSLWWCSIPQCYVLFGGRKWTLGIMLPPKKLKRHEIGTALEVRPEQERMYILEVVTHSQKIRPFFWKRGCDETENYKLHQYQKIINCNGKHTV